MTNTAILKENENKRLTFWLPLLIFFALYVTWQMGIVYFSGETLSIDGRTPLPVNVDDFTLIIAAGYILSILVMIFIPHIVVWTERITAAVALLGAGTLFLPLPIQTLTALYYVQCFACIFMIGFESSIIINLFSEQTAIKHLLVAYPVAQLFIVVLQNDFVKVPFPAFAAFTIAALALMLVFFFKLPAKGSALPRYVKKEDNIVAPKSLFAGILLLTGLSALSTLFGTGIAESVTHGVSVLYLSSAVSGIVMFLVWKKFKIAPFKSCNVLVGVTAFGFVLAIAAQYLPALSLVACVFLGAGVSLCWLNPLFGVMIAKRYPSRFIAPAIIGIAFITVLIHTTLLDALRDNLTALYVVYLAISVVMAILYLMLEPYLLYSFRGRTLQDIIGIVAEETDGETLVEEVTETAPSAAMAAETGQAEITQAEADALHARRMEILLSHAVEPLTKQEYKVTNHIMLGLTRSEIAAALGIKGETVSKYRSAAYSKFGIHKRSDLFKLSESLDREILGEDE